MTYVIALPCVDVLDRACGQECPVDCVHEGARSLDTALVAALPPQTP